LSFEHINKSGEAMRREIIKNFTNADIFDKFANLTNAYTYNLKLSEIEK